MDLNKLEKVIRKQKVAFICSVDEDGYPNVKAMLKPRENEGVRVFYFSTNTSSMRVKQYMNNPNACIYFYHKGLIKYTGVMLKGKMEVLTDQETKNLLWRKGDIANKSHVFRQLFKCEKMACYDQNTPTAVRIA